MDIIGKITKICEAETGSSSRGEWSKQGFVLETQDQYPKQVYITSWNNKIPLSNFNEGDTVQVFINVSSREYNEKWYTDVQAWRMEKPAAEGAPSGAPAPSAEDELVPEGDNKEDLNDLPF